MLNGKVQPGGTVAIVGAGPIGLAALLTAQFYSPAEIIMIDLDDGRLALAKRLGATATVNSGDGKAAEAVLAMTGQHGVDTVIEAVGLPETFELCQRLVAAGGSIANIGVHGRKVDLHLETLWSRNVSITTSLVDTFSTPMLLKTLCAPQAGHACLDHAPLQARADRRCLQDLRRCRQDAGAEGHHRGLSAGLRAWVLSPCSAPWPPHSASA